MTNAYPRQSTFQQADAPRMGRLIVVFERQLSAPSRAALHDLLEDMWGHGDVTWISGICRASTMELVKNGDNFFYNQDYISAEQALTLMPWREVWLVAGGQVWRLDSQS